MTFTLPDVVRRISTCLDPARKQADRRLSSREQRPDRTVIENRGSAPSHAHDPSRGRGSNGRDGSAPTGHAADSEPTAARRITAWRSPRSPRSATSRGQVRFFRYGSVVTNWEIKHEIPGPTPDQEPGDPPQGDLCQAIERELMSVLGVDSYKTNPLTSTVLVQYDTKELTRDQIIEIIDGALATAEHPPQQGQARPAPAALHDLDAAGGRGPVRRAGAAARGRGPVRLHVDPHLQECPRGPRRGEAAGGRRPRRDRGGRLPGRRCRSSPARCSAGASSFGRVLVKKTQDNSKKLLLNAFGKQPRFVWLYRDGVEVQVSLDRLPGRRHHRGQHRRGGAGRRRSSPRGWR